MRAITILAGAFLVTSACGEVAEEKAEKSAAASASDAGPAAAKGDGSARTCTPRPGCTSTTRCTDACDPGSGFATTCECKDGAWECGGITCQAPVPPTDPAYCPVYPPKPKDACTFGAQCDYGECLPSCRCTAAGWECTQDDCVPECPDVPVADAPCFIGERSCPAPKATTCTCKDEGTGARWRCVPQFFDAGTGGG